MSDKTEKLRLARSIVSVVETELGDRRLGWDGVDSAALRELKATLANKVVGILMLAAVLLTLFGTSPASAAWGMCLTAMPSCANPSCQCGTGSFDCHWVCVGGGR